MLVRKMVAALGVRVAVMGSGFGISVLLARILGAEEFGHYVFALSITMLLAVPVQAGLPVLLTKNLPRFEVNNDWSRVRGILLYVLSSTVTFSAVAFLGYWLIYLWYTNNSDGYAGENVVHLAILLVPFIALSTSLGAAIRNLGQLVTGQVVETGLRQIVLLVVILVAAFGLSISGLTATSAMAMHIIAAIGTAFVGATFLVVAHRIGPRGTKPKVEWRNWTISLFPLSLIAGLQIILSKTDVVMLRGIIGAEEVAFYFIAKQLANLVFLSFQAVELVSGPTVSRALQRRDHETLQHTYSRSASFVLVSTLPLSFCLLQFGESILAYVYGSEMVGAYSAVAILAIGYVVQAMFGSPELALKITGHHRVVLKTMAIAAVVNIALNAWFISLLGVAGAAIASVLVTITMKFSLCVVVWFRLNIVPFAFSEYFLRRDSA